MSRALHDVEKHLRTLQAVYLKFHYYTYIFICSMCRIL